MTTLISWISVDQHAPAALYMASDSRISWGSPRARWDAGRKLFACRKFPDLFGYAGEVVFPSLVLGQISDAADLALFFRDNDDSHTRHGRFVEAIKVSFDHRHNVPNTKFCILHASRELSGRKAEFRLWRLTYDPKGRTWSDILISVPNQRSTLLAALGSGEESLRFHSQRWEASAQGGTSRSIFSAFCDSIKSNKDLFSGGVPQLVGMYHTRMPQAFGIVCNGQRHLHGFPLPIEIASEVIEWRDELFQRIDGRTLRVISGAQRHVRPILRH
jgi:hypothetical protein